MGAALLELPVTFSLMCHCCWEGCGVAIIAASDRETTLREKHHNFYCINGHQQSFRGKTEAENLKERLADIEGKLKQASEYRDRETKRANQAELTKKQTQGELRAIKERVKNGVCPCCRRSFRNLQRHMSTKHPGYASEAPTGEAQ